MFDAADEPVVAEPPPATGATISTSKQPPGAPSTKAGSRLNLLASKVEEAPKPEFDLQLLEEQLFVAGPVCAGQDASCSLKQSALLFCVPTKSQSPFLQYRLSSNHTHWFN